MKSGKRDITCIKDANNKFNASFDDKYTYKPLIGNFDFKYYCWAGEIVYKEGNTYYCWNGERGFGFYDIKNPFNNLQYYNEIVVVGRYVDNVVILLTSGSRKTLPLLSDCYVFNKIP